MEQVMIVDENGEFFGECPKCKNWRKLEFAHHEYAGKRFSESTGMYLCHTCNMHEKTVNPEKTTTERGKIAARDYCRRNRITLSLSMGKGRTLEWQYNRKTGQATLNEKISQQIFSTNIGTDYPEIVYVQDGEIEQ